MIRYAPVSNIGVGVGTSLVLSGHLAIGGASLNLFVGMFGDQTYLNTTQEVRGVSSTVRNIRTVPDDPTGWDFYGLIGSAVVDAGNTKTINGQIKACVGEIHLIAPSSGSYSVGTAFSLQGDMPDLGAGVTLTNYYGLVINNVPATNPLSGAPNTGTLLNQYGVNIENLTKGATTIAAVNLQGTGVGGRILWPGPIDFQAPSAGVAGLFSGATKIFTGTLTAGISQLTVGNGGTGVNYGQVLLNFGTNSGANNLHGEVIAQRNGVGVGQLQWNDGASTILDISGTNFIVRNAFGGSTIFTLSSAGLQTISGLVLTGNAAITLTNQVNGAGVATGTLTNAPKASNPDFWIPVSVNGTAGWIPWWHA